jgi:tRNA-2-methylthio-N6-dimethylallyladenosine synthase
MNERDSEKMAALLLQMGFEKAAAPETADLIVYNTCCVRESAEDKIFGHLSRLKPLKAERPGVIIAIGGCMTQQTGIMETIKNKHKYVDIIFGTTNRHRLPEFLWRAFAGERVIDISENEDLPEITDIPVTTREFAHKAGVNIMYGCDNFCSYCIVPYVRGREKSRPVADILEEIRTLAADGVREVMLLGQNVNAYKSKDFPLFEKSGAKTLTFFPELLRLVNNIEGLERIRFMTSHPKDFSDELIAAIRDCEKVCKHVHLPLQAGSTKVLKDMNRHYTKEEYLAVVEKRYAAVPQIAITTDIIVGFPGETEEDFADTLDVVRRVKFAGAFTFIYSKRSGTPAAERTDSVPRKIISERFDRLTAELYPLMTTRNESKIGQILPVMVEEAGKGRTDDHTLVHFSSKKEFSQGETVPIKIDAAKTFYVSGRIL